MRAGLNYDEFKLIMDCLSIANDKQYPLILALVIEQGMRRYGDCFEGKIRQALNNVMEKEVVA